MLAANIIMICHKMRRLDTVKEKSIDLVLSVNIIQVLPVLSKRPVARTPAAETGASVPVQAQQGC